MTVCRHSLRRLAGVLAGEKLNWMGILSIDAFERDKFNLLEDLICQRRNFSRKQATYVKYSSPKEQQKGVTTVFGNNGKLEESTDEDSREVEMRH